VLDLVPAIILAMIIDLFASGNVVVTLFVKYVIILIGVGITDTFLRLFAKYHFSLLSNKITRDARVESFHKVLQGDLVWQDKENTGNKIQKINSGEEALGKFMTFYINKGLNLIIQLIGVIIVFAYFNIKYSLLAIFFIFVYMTFELLLNKKVAQKTLESKLARERAAGKTYEFSSAISTVKSIGMEAVLGKKISGQEEMVYQTKRVRKKASTAKWMTVSTIATLFFALFIFLVGKDIIAGVLSVGTLVIYIDYVKRLRTSLGVLTLESTNLIDMKYGLYRMMEIYRTVPEVDETWAKDLEEWRKINIMDLSFGYNREATLHGLNFEIKKGQKIGIVGTSGCGKSTLFKLLLKLYIAQNGDILFDNKSISEITKESLLDNISVVPQHTDLFNLSLKENITISAPGKTNYNQYLEALRISRVSEFLPKLKKKDLTLLGEQGTRLSGGQRQRIGIARALYKDSDIIILDEATANLDYKTESKILNSFDKELKNKTLIVSTHRLTNLKHMDNIIFLHKGRIVEQGTFNQLMARKGKFYSTLKARGNK
jgi:ABC-type multidrug transport system fused ATPase/permease subunit